MYFEVVVEVILALFAVFGFYSAAGMAVEAIFKSDRCAVAVEIQSPEDLNNLDLLLHDAVNGFVGFRPRRLIVIADSSLFAADGESGGESGLGEEADKLLEKYGAECIKAERM